MPYLLSGLAVLTACGSKEAPRTLGVSTSWQEVEYKDHDRGFACTFVDSSFPIERGKDSGFRTEDIILIRHWDTMGSRGQAIGTNNASFEASVGYYGEDCLELYSTIEERLAKMGVTRARGLRLEIN